MQIMIFTMFYLFTTHQGINIFFMHHENFSYVLAFGNDFSLVSHLTYYYALLPSHRSEFIDLHSKSIDWFLYESHTGV